MYCKDVYQMFFVCPDIHFNVEKQLQQVANRKPFAIFQKKSGIVSDIKDLRHMQIGKSFFFLMHCSLTFSLQIHLLLFCPYIVVIFCHYFNHSLYKTTIRTWAINRKIFLISINTVVFKYRLDIHTSISKMWDIHAINNLHGSVTDKKYHRRFWSKELWHCKTS